MDQTTAWMTVIVVGVGLVVLVTVLVRKWNRENRAKYPDRASDRFFEINRRDRDEND